MADLKTPPHSVSAEQSVIGGLLYSNDAWHQVAAVIDTHDFYRRDHRLIFGAMKSLLAEHQPCDAVTLCDALHADGKLEDAGGHDYIASLCEEIPSAANVVSYAGIVRESSILRQVIDAAHHAAGRASTREKSAPIIAELQSRLDTINTRRYGSDLDWSSVLRRGVNLLSDIELSQDGAGISTGLPKLDNWITGIHGPRLIVVAGRPSLGKTALSQQIAINAAHDGHRIGICSLEMSAEELSLRSMAYRCQVDFGLLMRGDDEAVRYATDNMASMHNYAIWTDTDTYSLSGLIARITQWKREHGIELAIVDHIGLVEADGYTSRNDQLGHVSRNFKKLAKQLDIPIMLVSQLNRSVEREKRRPKLSDLRDSGNIEQDADVVVFIHSDDEDGSDAVEVELGLLKNRCGRKGWIKGYQFRGAYQRFEERVMYGLPPYAAEG